MKNMEYPNLQTCRVTIQSERSIVQPPVRLPIDIVQQVQQTIPKPIDFTVGMCVFGVRYYRLSLSNCFASVVE